MVPGEIFPVNGALKLNEGRKEIILMISNTGDRPVQVGSHYHFAECNAALEFNRGAAHGYRLNIAPGTAVRFEPGPTSRSEPYRDFRCTSCIWF